MLPVLAPVKIGPKNAEVGVAQLVRKSKQLNIKIFLNINNNLLIHDSLKIIIIYLTHFVHV